MADLNVTMEFNGTSYWPAVLFQRELEQNNYKYFSAGSWKGRDIDLSDAAHVYTDDDDHRCGFFRDDDGGLFYLSIHGGYASCSVAGETQEIVDRLLAKAKVLAPEYVEPDKNKVPVSFWSMSNHGPSVMVRSLEVHKWDDIQINYPHDVGGELTPFMNGEWRPSQGGQLMLWYGPPGTGKTTALRALASEWRDWCEMHYIADPEVFFGDRADYMLKVMLQDSYDTPLDDGKEQWRLLILEDCGELIGRDAKIKSGQGLSRLLNSVDGLIGQGLRFMVLVTSNEDYDSMHPAVVRPGRCLSQIEFANLNGDEVTRWLKAHKVENDDARKSSASLADLYASKQHFGTKKKKQTLGFA